MRFLTRMYRAISGQIASFGRWVIGLDPIAVAKDEIESVTESVKQHNGELKQKERYIQELQHEAATLEAKIKAALARDDQANATQFATQLGATRKRIQTAQENLERFQASYKKAVENIHKTASKIASEEREIRELKAEVKSSELDARLTDLSANLNTGSLDSVLSGTAEMKERLKARIDRNNGRVEATEDLTVQADPYDSIVAGQDVDAILAEFKK